MAGVLVAMLVALAGLAACSGSKKPDAASPPVEGVGVRWLSGANANYPRMSSLGSSSPAGMWAWR